VTILETFAQSAANLSSKATQLRNEKNWICEFYDSYVPETF